MNHQAETDRTSRRVFLQKAGVAAAALAAGAPTAFAGPASAATTRAVAKAPWYRRTLRWGQTNITELDPTRYDIGWWRRHWQRTQVQGVIINAGGIVAYYPSKFPLQHRAEFLGDRDLYGELAAAAHADGLVVLARMDSNRADAAFYQAHPDWFARDAAGQPYRAGDLYVACVNSPYYRNYIPALLQEIVERSHPEGVTDNSWSGLGRNSICHCDHCARQFRDWGGQGLPRHSDWRDENYRQWIRWNYQRRLEIWDANNRATQAAGGSDCLWIGMNSGSVAGQAASFRDYRQICRRAQIIMLDHQARSESGGFQDNGLVGKLVHGLLGWDKLIPESMAMYQAGRATFRLASKPAPEAQLWMVEGFAGGLQPWWHHVGAYHEDRRMYHTAEGLCRWHKSNQEFLVDRRPIASVGLVWSQQNADFHGRDQAEDLTELPFRGLALALTRARIPYVPIHVDDLERDSAKVSLLVLPNLAAMSDTQVMSIRHFVERGGGLVATGETSQFDESGQARSDFGLADLFGVHTLKPTGETEETARRRWAVETAHTYLRLAPELRARVDGPQAGTEPPAAGSRHPVLHGFDQTDILPFGGRVEPLALEPDAQVLMTFIPPFPIYPPETAWMREPRTNLPALILRTRPSGARVAFLPADLDRRYGRDRLPDHGDLLANLVRWAAKDQLPVEVVGPGLIDCHLYSQPGRLILHLINLSGAGRGPLDEVLPVGPLRVRVRSRPSVSGRRVRFLVSGQSGSTTVKEGWWSFEVKSILDHEVAVLS